jgi:Rrf2 family protein
MLLAFGTRTCLYETPLEEMWKPMLSNKAKYALKAMFALTALQGNELLQSNEIAEIQNIPKKFLDLILLELRRHGLVQSYRGQQGGYALARPPNMITLGNIVRVIDGPLAPIACASVTGYQRCADCDPDTCLVRYNMRKVRDAISAILDQTTLEEASRMKPKKQSAPSRREILEYL